jgi:hypothetical protein
MNFFQNQQHTNRALPQIESYRGMVGILGSIVIEGVLLNSGHLSYRMNRILFRQHWAMLSVAL